VKGISVPGDVFSDAGFQLALLPALGRVLETSVKGKKVATDDSMIL
jgi:hypothetical protein